MSKHTEGPWSIADYKTMNTGAHVILSPKRGPDDPHPVVASVVKRPGYAANARIIAAAPDLLAAAKALVRLHDELADETDQGVVAAAFERWDAGVSALEVAIAKAEGQR